ncbi:MAG TPA: hypothetical protein P5531_09065 [Bacteroidales bacterium]|nr:hypothetical protein [Bacteroidales bacterium]HSA44778.1 hypothetical protein [Bacteroidales bacterium]
MRIVKLIAAKLVVFLLIPMTSYSQVNVMDSLVLVEFYNAANGPTWYNNTNWLQTGVRYWHGIYLDATKTRVVGIGLPNNNLNGVISPLLCQLEKLGGIFLEGNNLTGQIPPCLGYCNFLTQISLDYNNLNGTIPTSLAQTVLQTLNVRGNHFEGEFPDSVMNKQYLTGLRLSNNQFTSITPRVGVLLSGLWVDTNKLTFQHIIPHALNPPYNSFHYSPQDSVLQETDTTVLIGSDLVLDAWVDTCQGNRYRWKKNGTYLTPLPVQNPQLLLSNIQYSDSGIYTCDITNPLAWALTLHRRLIRVKVSGTNDVPPDQAEVSPIRIRYLPGETRLDIRFSFVEPTDIQCGLFDINGRKILRLYEGQVLNEKLNYNLKWLSPGVYVMAARWKDKTLTWKILR